MECHFIVCSWIVSKVEYLFQDILVTCSLNFILSFVFVDDFLFFFSLALVIFQIGFNIFCPDWPGPQSSYLCLPSSWDNRCVPSCPACWLRWGGRSLTNSLPWQALNVILLISTLWVAEIILMRPYRDYQHLAFLTDF
jgi:hypothetical protein